MRFRKLVAGIRAGALHVLLVIAACCDVHPGIGPYGFFDEYLILGPYRNPDGDHAGTRRQAEDFLCDGRIGEESIQPARGLLLDFPQVAGCAASNSGYLGEDKPAVGVARTAGDLLDLLAAYPEMSNAVAYVWVYIENRTANALSLNLALTSDDGVQVTVDGTEVFNISAPLFFGEAGFIHDRLAVTLSSGVTLFQFKVFQGGGYWGLRARLEDPETGRPILKSDTRLLVGTVGGRTGGFEATRKITVEGALAASISVTSLNEGASYTLSETLRSGWEVEAASTGYSIHDGTITWKDVMVSEIHYRIVRT